MSEALNSSPEILRCESASMRIAAMLIVVIGMDTFIVQPGFVQGLVEKGGFGDKQAGYIAAAAVSHIKPR